MGPIIEKPDKIFKNIKSELSKGVKNRNHGFHTPIFSNFNNDNQISSRVIVLRQFDPNRMEIHYHSDIRSRKINNLKSNPKTIFLFYDHKIKIQLQIKTITKVYHNNEITKNAWNNTKLMSRKCYLTKYPPSSKINYATDGIPEYLKGKEPTFEESEGGFLNFAVISNQILAIEWLSLSSSGHRRLCFVLKDNKMNHQWLIP